MRMSNKWIESASFDPEYTEDTPDGQPEVCKWTFRHCGYIFGDPTGYMGTECGRSWSELVDYKKLTFCPYCGKQIEVTK
jgi:DNA-directed RNA polymerase subunit RPC12/RpoP